MNPFNIPVQVHQPRQAHPSAIHNTLISFYYRFQEWACQKNDANKIAKNMNHKAARVSSTVDKHQRQQ
jgi:hypothetical protein